MKKAIQSFSIATCLVLSMIACNSNENKPANTAAETTSAATTPAPTVETNTTVAPAPTTTPTPTAATPTAKATVTPTKVTATTSEAKDLSIKGTTPAASTTPSVSAATTTPTPAKSAAVVKWDETVHNWGSIKQGEKMTHVFKFKNTGSEPLIILDAKGSCGCTVPEKPAAPIAPGKTGEIKVVFDSNGKEGPQTKVVTVTANTEPSNFALTIKGDVKKD